MALIDWLDWESADDHLETKASVQSGPQGQMLAEFLQSGVCDSKRWLKEAVFKLEEVSRGRILGWNEELPYHVITVEPNVVRLQLLYGDPNVKPYDYPLDEMLAVSRRWLVAIERAPNFADTFTQQ